MGRSRSWPEHRAPAVLRPGVLFTEEEVDDKEAAEHAARVEQQLARQARYAALARACEAAPAGSGGALAPAPSAALLAGLEMLPAALAARVLALVPLHTRLTLPLVHPTWRQHLRRNLAIWQVLDLSVVPPAVVSSALLRAGAARAGGTLRQVNASGCLWALGTETRGLLTRTGRGLLVWSRAADPDRWLCEDAEGARDEERNLRGWVSGERALPAVLAANAATLERVTACCTYPLCDAPAAAGVFTPQLMVLLRAMQEAPAAAQLHADVACTPAQAPALLRRYGSGVAQRLRVRRLTLCGTYDRESASDSDEEGPRPVGNRAVDAALLTLLAEHPSLETLELDRCHLHPQDGAGAAAALAACANITGLVVRGFPGPMHAPHVLQQSPAMPPELLQPLLTSALRELSLTLPPLHDAAEAAELAAVLRGAPLEQLSLTWPCAERGPRPELRYVPCTAPPGALHALLAGLAGHPTLRRLWLRDMPLSHHAGVADVVALLTRDAPALTELHVSGVPAPGAEDEGAGRSNGEEGSTTLAAAVRTARRGAPCLRTLAVPAACLEARVLVRDAGGDAGADGNGAVAVASTAAEAGLQHLLLLRCYDAARALDHGPSTSALCGRGPLRRWLPAADLMDASASASAALLRALAAEAAGEENEQEC